MSETTTIEPGFTTDMGHGEPVYPFYEDQDANITGYGHQDKATFAAEIRRFDEYCGMDPDDLEDWTDNVCHQWVVFGPDGERLFSTTAGTPGAIPVTTLWGSR